MWYYLIVIQLTANAHAITSNLGEYKGIEACQTAAAAIQNSHPQLSAKFVCVAKYKHPQ